MIKKYGTVTKIKILQIGARPLIRFSLNDTNCLIAGHGLNFLAEVDEGMKLVISGYYNQRNQLVVKEYHMLGPTKILIDFKKIKKEFIGKK